MGESYKPKAPHETTKDEDIIYEKVEKPEFLDIFSD